jgi:hypothetical protein
MRASFLGFIFGLLAGSTLYSQQVLSAHSGVIHQADGRVFVDDKVVELKFGQFPELKPNQELRTEEGRAEILLTPGSFLRLGENSAVRMISNQLTDTQVEVLSGSAMVECEQLLKDNAITLIYKDDKMLVEKAGLYRVDSDPARFRVYEGEAIVRSDSGQLTLKTGKEVPLAGVLAASKFDNQVGDELYRWSKRRSNDLAVANVSAARSAYTSGSGSYGYGSSYGGYGLGYGGWSFNPWFGMFTFIPYSGIAYSPFGYSFWSPYSAFYYAPQYFYGGGGTGTVISSPSRNGFTGRGRTSGGTGRAVSGGRGVSAGGGIGSRGVSAGSMGHGGLSSAGGHSSGGGHR